MSIKIIESTIEKLAWVLVVFLVILFSIAAFYAIKNNRAIKEQQQVFHSQNVENQQIIIIAVKNYIACLLTLNAQSPTPLSVQEQVCFDKAPQVKP